MLMSAVWVALHEAGVEATVVDAEWLELRSGADRVRVWVYEADRPLNPSDIVELLRGGDGAGGLVVVPAATSAARQTAAEAGCSLLVVDDRGGVSGEVRLSRDRVVPVDTRVGGPVARRRPRGRVPWGSFSVVRRLLQTSVATQRDLAAVAGVSQPRVSQALRRLVDAELVTRTRDGAWRAAGWDELLDDWLSTYPGPGGLTGYWYGLEPVVGQAEAVVSHLVQTAAVGDAGPVAVVSGDVAADRVAPWRDPRRAVVYARSGSDLSGLGFTPSGEAEATLEVIVPRDPGVWPAPGAGDGSGDMGGLADPVQVLWDVHRGEGPDVAEAADRVRGWLRERYERMSWHGAGGCDSNQGRGR
ncbi:MAG: MarR family transcriptional regulator [Nocardioidaceae bacterium]